jgi:general secretion pathway protein D
MQLPMVDAVPEFDPGVLDRDAAALGVSVAAKIERIIIPTFRTDQSTLQEALDLLRIRARENDTMETDDSRRGININLTTAGASPDVEARIRGQRIDLQLSNASVAAILRYLCDMTGTNFTTDDFSVIIRPLATFREETISRTFRVPADFISTLSTSAPAGGDQARDPFDQPPSGGLLSQRLGIREALEANGVAFPEGTSVVLTGNVLRVSHTAAAMEVIEQLVNAAAETEPVAAIVTVKMVRVQEDRLTELGFDWLLGNFDLSGSGSDFLGVSGGTQGSGSDLSDLDPILVGPMNPITAGNRSGSQAISPDNIDSEIARAAFGSRQESFRAPGILSISGAMNSTTAQMVMRGLDQQRGVDTMQQPSVVTRSGQAASVQVIREFSYPTEYEPPELPNTAGAGAGTSPVTPTTPTAFEVRDVGMKLEVLPVADSSRNYIDLTLVPEFVEFDGFMNYGSPITTSASGGPLAGTRRVELTRNAILMPVFSTRRLNTSITIADGSTVVVGGLLSSRVQDVEDRTPILGDLPVVGRLFQTKARQPLNTALVFFVTVELIDPTGRPYRDR